MTHNILNVIDVSDSNSVLADAIIVSLCKRGLLLNKLLFFRLGRNCVLYVQKGLE
jgi:hypothetical protein